MRRRKVSLSMGGTGKRQLASGIRRICFVTGTRAEFGLMSSVLAAVKAHPKLDLQIVATGMHLDRAHGRTINTIRNKGWTVDATVAWKTGDQTQLAQSTGAAISRLAQAYDKLRSDIVLVVGDRVEAFAAAAAAHIAGRVVAHVHGGDRALGQIDDSLRHAITKLAHVHFPATRLSAMRIAKLGEDPWRIHLVGSPGIDSLRADACPRSTASRRYAYAVILLHPTSPDDDLEYRRAGMLLNACRKSGPVELHCIYPNNDPGTGGIIRCWRENEDAFQMSHENLPRDAFLGLMRDAAMLIGNSSSGIIEAASFGTPVIDISDRQKGRERNANVIHVPWKPRAIQQAIARVWNKGRSMRFPRRNLYGRGDTGPRIARILAAVNLDERLRRKLIAY